MNSRPQSHFIVARDQGILEEIGWRGGTGGLLNNSNGFSGLYSMVHFWKNAKASLQKLALVENILNDIIGKMDR